MESAWIGFAACLGVIYYGVLHVAGHPWALLDWHAFLLVTGGTLAVAFLTYSPSRLFQVFEFVLMGFLFRTQRAEYTLAQDILGFIALHFRSQKNVYVSKKPHPFLEDSFRLLQENEDLSEHELLERLQAQRDAIRRRYAEDAKILTNMARYPVPLGLLGCLVGVIRVTSGPDPVTVDSWGLPLAGACLPLVVGMILTYFVFRPLADNAAKAVDDEIYRRDLVIAVVDKIKRGGSVEAAIHACLDRLSLVERSRLLGSFVPAAKPEPLRRAG